MNKFTAAIGALLLVSVQLTAGTLAVIDHSPRLQPAGSPARVIDTVCAILGSIDLVQVVLPARSDSILRIRRIDVEMATPRELSDALGATHILHIGVRVRRGMAVLSGKLYDIAKRRTAAEYADSCTDGLREPDLLGAIMAWTFAQSVADSAGAIRARNTRDSLTEAYQAPYVAARRATEENARRRHQLDSLVRSRTRKYDVAGLPLAVLSAGCLVTGVIFHYQANDQEHQAEEMQDYLPYLPYGHAEQIAKIAKAEDEAERYRTIRNTCYWAAGFSGVTAAILIATRCSVAGRVRAEYQASARAVTVSYEVARW